MHPDIPAPSDHATRSSSEHNSNSSNSSSAAAMLLEDVLAADAGGISPAQAAALFDLVGAAVDR